MKLPRVLLGPSLPLVTFATLGCAGDSTDPNGNGNDAPTLSGDVQPIFTSSCALSGCHGGSNAQPTGKPQNLTAGNSFASIVNVSSLQVPSMDRVEPDQPDDSYLVHKIEGTQASVGGTGDRMPAQGCCLTNAEIQTIRDWIAAGALNN